MNVDITYDQLYFVLSSDYIFELNVVRNALTREIPNAWMLKKITSVQNTDRCFMNNYNMVPVGLWLEIITVCKNNNIQVQFTENALNYINHFNFIEFDKFKECILKIFEGAENDKGPFIPYDYQIEAAYKILKYRKCCAEISTSGGKTLISFIIFKYLYEVLGVNNILYVVPTKGLVSQSKQDFEEYESFLTHHNKEYTIGILKSGLTKKEKDEVETCNILFGTFQSLTKKSPEFLSKFLGCINDECCHPDTMIQMADGTLKKISEVNVGDEVYTYNEHTKCIDVNEVEYVYKNLSNSDKLYEIELDEGEILKVTGNHKILTLRGYIRADELDWKDIVCRYTEEYGQVEYGINYIIDQPYDGDVYNLRIKSDTEYNHNYFANGICVSNCHHVASSTSIKTLLSKCTSLIYSFGVTGTFPRQERYEYLTLQAYIGPVIYKLTADQLINQVKRATPIYAVIEYLNYVSEDDKKTFYLLRSNKDPNDIQSGAKILKQERLFVNNQYTRLKYICDKVISTKKNSLVLFGDIKYGYGLKVFDYIKDNSDKDVYYVDGNTPVQNREYYIECMENDESGNTVIVASINTFGEGINIKNLWSIFLVDTAKSERLVRQICGRGLRLYPGKDKVVLFDFVDDLRYSDHPNKKWKDNYLYKHSNERKKIYEEQKFPIFKQTVNFR